MSYTSSQYPDLQDHHNVENVSLMHLANVLVMCKLTIIALHAALLLSYQSDKSIVGLHLPEGVVWYIWYVYFYYHWFGNKGMCIQYLQ